MKRLTDDDWDGNVLKWTELDTAFLAATLDKDEKYIPITREEIRKIHESLPY